MAIRGQKENVLRKKRGSYYFTYCKLYEKKASRLEDKNSSTGIPSVPTTKAR